MQHFQKRLMQFIEYELHISVREFEKNCNLPQGTVQRAINGTNMGIDKLIAISKVYPKLNLDWLLSGDGDMYDANITHNIASDTIVSYDANITISLLNLSESNKILADAVHKAIESNLKLIDRVS